MTTDVHTLSGAYALDALSPEEIAEFRRHLASCEACCDEVRELRDAAARMGAGRPLEPPAGLRHRVLTAAAHTPQLPPPVVPITRRRPRMRTAWLGLAVAAAVIVAGVAVGVDVLGQRDERPLIPAAAAVFEAQDARTVTVETGNGGELRVGVSRGEGEMAVDTRGLPRLDDKHAYQLWTIRGDEAVSQGVLGQEPVGAAMPIPDGETQVALTIEPSEGSARPTTDPIALLSPADV